MTFIKQCMEKKMAKQKAPMKKSPMKPGKGKLPPGAPC